MQVMSHKYLPNLSPLLMYRSDDKSYEIHPLCLDIGLGAANVLLKLKQIRR